MNDNKPFGELGVGMKININDLNAIYSDCRPIIIDPVAFGTLGLSSMLRSFTKDEFVLDYVPDYALLKEEAERIRVWDHYGKASEQEIGEMLISGWKRKSEFTAALELRAVGTLEPGA